MSLQVLENLECRECLEGLSLHRIEHISDGPVKVLEAYVSDSGEVTLARRVRVRLKSAGEISGNQRNYEGSKEASEALDSAIEKLNTQVQAGIQVLNYLSHSDMVTTSSGKYAGFDALSNPRISQIDTIFKDSTGNVWSDASFLLEDKKVTPEAFDWAARAAREEYLPVSWRTASQCDGENQTGTCKVLDMNGWDWLDPETERPGFASAKMVQVLESESVNPLDISNGSDTRSEGQKPGSPESSQISEDKMDLSKIIEACKGKGMSKKEAKEFILSIVDSVSEADAEVALEGYEEPGSGTAPSVPNQTQTQQTIPVVPASVPATTVVVPAAGTEKKEKVTDVVMDRVRFEMERRIQKEETEGAIFDALQKPTFESFTLANFSAPVIESARKKAVEYSESPEQAFAILRQEFSEAAKAAAAATESKEAQIKGTQIVEDYKEGTPWKEIKEKFHKAINDYNRQHNPDLYRVTQATEGRRAEDQEQLDRLANTRGKAMFHEWRAYQEAAKEGTPGYDRNAVANARLAATEALVESHRQAANEDLMPSETNFPYYSLFTNIVQDQTWWQMMGRDLVNTPTGNDIQLGQVVGQLGRHVSVFTRYLKQIESGRPSFKVKVREVPREVIFEDSTQQFFAERQKIGCRLNDQDLFYLSRAPRNFDQTAYVLAGMSQVLARNEDLDIHTEILTASDEYKPLVVQNETTQSGEFTYTAGGSVASGISGITYGANCTAVATLRRGAATGSVVNGPITRQRSMLDNRGWNQNVYQGLVEYNVNPVTFAGADTSGPIGYVNSKAQVMGYLDDSLTIQPINPGDTPTFAVNWDVGEVVFVAAATSGVDGTHLPTFAQYSASRNFSFISQDVPAGYTRETYSNVWISAIRDLTSEIRAKRYQYFEFALGYETTMTKNITDANAFMPLTRKEFANLNTNFGPQITLGSVNGVDLLKTDTPLPGGSRRIILNRRGNTMYFLTEPLRMFGPFDETKNNASGYSSLTGGKIWYMGQTRLLCSPKKLFRDNTPFEYPGYTLYATGTTPGITLGIV